ncbi:MAG: hypothetical protein ACK52I_31435, partial [Pseudomonadota bacterium]
MRYIILVIALFIASIFHAQWPSFNEAIPVSVQSPPFDYLQQGSFQNVFQVDLAGTQQDGYLVYGRGVLESPGSSSQYMRAFACKTNSEGDAMWWRRFDHDSLELNSTWVSFKSGQGMVEDESGMVHSTYTEWNQMITEPWNRSKSYVVVMDYNAEIMSEVQILHDTTYLFGYSGLLYDASDSTHILYGSWLDSTMYFANDSPDAFLSKVGNGGEVLWERHYPNTFGVWHVIRAMDGGYWIMG